MVGRRAGKKRRQKVRRSRTRAGTQTSRSSSRLKVGLIVAAGALILVVGGALALLANSKDLPQDQSAAGRSIVSPNADVSFASATIGGNVGNRIPDVDIRLYNGDTVSTSKLVDEGKPTFLYFFATW